MRHHSVEYHKECDPGKPAFFGEAACTGRKAAAQRAPGQRLEILLVAIGNGLILRKKFEVESWLGLQMTHI